MYDMFSEDVHVIDELPASFDRLIVGGDYGMNNPRTFLLIGQKGTDFYVIREYYYSAGQKKGQSEEEAQARQKTVAQYVDEFIQFLGDDKPQYIFLDPSAAALIIELKKRSFANIKGANNDRIDGIQLVQQLLGGHEGRLYWMIRSFKRAIEEGKTPAERVVLIKEVSKQRGRTSQHKPRCYCSENHIHGCCKWRQIGRPEAIGACEEKAVAGSE